MVGRQTLKPLIIGSALEAVVENLIEPCAHELLTHKVLQFVAAVGVALHAEAALDRGGDFHIVVAIDAENVLHHIAGTLHIHPIGRHRKGKSPGSLLIDVHFQAFHDTLDGGSRDVLANEGIHIVVAEVHLETFGTGGAHVCHLHAHLGTCQLAGQDGGLLEGIDLSVGVDAALKAETGIGVQAMEACTLAYPCGMEICALEQHVAGGLISAAALAAEHARDAHGLLGVTDGQVAAAELVLHTIERDKGGALGQGLHHHLLSLDHVHVETMEGLAIGHHDVVGDVHDVVDGTQTNHTELVLEPLGTFLHLTAGEGEGTVAGACLGLLHLYLDREFLVVHHKVVGRRAMERCGVAVLHEPGIEVARHTIVAAGVRPVGGDIHLNHIVALDMVILGGGYAHGGVGGQHNDTAVVLSYANLVLGTYHAQALHTAQLAPLDGEALVAVIELGAHHGRYHFLAGSHIGGATHYLERLFLSHVHSAHMHVVAVGMGFAGEHLCRPQAFKPALDRLHLLHTAHFQTDAGEGIGHFLCAERGVYVFTKPFV